MENIIEKVAGVTKENEDGVNRQDLLKLLVKDKLIEFKAEPDNRYDDQAIAIVNRFGQTLGYVPANYPGKDRLFKAVRCGFYEFEVKVKNLKDPTRWNAKGGKRYSWGLDISWDYHLLKDGDYDDEPEVQSVFRDPIQKRKSSDKHWKDVVKKNRKGRLTYQEVEAIKAAC